MSVQSLHWKNDKWGGYFWQISFCCLTVEMTKYQELVYSNIRNYLALQFPLDAGAHTKKKFFFQYLHMKNSRKIHKIVYEQT